MASAVVGVGRDLNTCFGAELIDHLLEDGTLGVSQQMVTVTEDKWVVSNTKTWVSARCKRWATNDHVHCAQSETLVDVGFFA